jgi:hypothetical protein
MARKKVWTPTDDDLKNAPADIAWEFAAMLAAALEMAKGHQGPTNHQSQEVFLLHVRNLAEFFYGKAERSHRKDNIYALDFCSAQLWTTGDFEGDTKLIRAINKTLSHMSYSRNPLPEKERFDGCFHAHGTVTLMRRTWADFLKALRPEFHAALLQGLHKHTLAEDRWGLRPLNDFGIKFDKMVTNNGWQLNETPNGPVSPFPYSPGFPYSI